MEDKIVETETNDFGKMHTAGSQKAGSGGCVLDPSNRRRPSSVAHSPDYRQSQVKKEEPR